MDALALVTNLNAVIRRMSGAAASGKVRFVKVVTTIGKPGVAAAAIAKGFLGFVMTHVEGVNPATLNGAAQDGPIGWCQVTKTSVGLLSRTISVKRACFLRNMSLIWVTAYLARQLP
jgi:hypothetical protein